MQRGFEMLCPVLFRDTDMKKLPCDVRTAHRVLDHDLRTRGLLMHGVYRTGKTRLAWLALEQLWAHGVDFDWMDAITFGIKASAAYRDGGENDFYAARVNPPVLFLDDVGKNKITARVGEALFGVIDKRMIRGKPTLITTNFTGASLVARFEDPDLGEALYQRLRECCEAVHVGMKKGESK